MQRPLKIAILTTDGRGSGLKYVSSGPTFGTSVMALLKGFSRCPGVEIHVISCLQNRLSSPEKLEPNVYYHGLHVPKLGWLRTGYQGCIRAVRRKLNEIRPDIVHGQGTERDCGISAIFSGFPNVITIHGNMAAIARQLEARPFSFHWITGKLEDFTLPRTRGVLCNSDHTEALVRHRAAKTWRVPNALQDVYFSTPLPSTAPRHGERRLLCVGYVSELKRQVALLELAEQLHAKCPSLTWKFIGDVGPETPYGTRFLEKLKRAGGWASHAEAINPDRLVHEFDAADALIHFPSEEAFGLVVAEALSRNRRVFAARVGGIPDVTQDAPGVELFGADDWDGLKGSVGAWALQQGRSETGASPLMRERFHPSVIAKRHLEIYLEVLSRTS
ncbi:MAG TPA: glycosyltransferase family 4 protein [Roseimicrobium sp.]|nr:glycosyltransferase family 4 protein [Roseimicrobium sp.]